MDCLADRLTGSQLNGSRRRRPKVHVDRPQRRRGALPQHVSEPMPALLACLSIRRGAHPSGAAAWDRCSAFGEARVQLHRHDLPQHRRAALGRLALAFATARSLALLAVATWYGDQRCASAATAGDRCFAPVDHPPRQPPPTPPPRHVAGVMPGIATCVFVLAPDRLKKRRRRAAGV